MADCCDPKTTVRPAGRFSGCILCGRPLRYEQEARPMICAVCGEEKRSACTCEEGHFVCDACHAAGLDEFFVPFLLRSSERDPLLLLGQLMEMPQVHLHGPEHHVLVPCVLLTAFHNCGGGNDLREDLSRAIGRARQVPGGTCGYWGVCGAAAGAGIYLSVLTGSHPVHESAWPLPQELVARCLRRNAELGGPRCCKRTSRSAIEVAARFTEELFGLGMPLAPVICRFCALNHECIRSGCPYYPGNAEEVHS